MRPGPELVIRAAIIGCLLIAIFGYAISAGAAPMLQTSNPPAESNLSSDSSAAQADITDANSNPQTADNKTKNAKAKNQAKTKQTGQACQVSDRFPDSILKWCGLISSYASQRGLPPDLVAAVMLQESGGDPNAYSKSGAVGLMQVMPRDGLASNFSCGDHPCFSSRPTIEELQNPEFNIDYGTGMLASLTDRLGNYRDALKAYGPIDMGYYYADLVLSIFKNYGKS